MMLSPIFLSQFKSYFAIYPFYFYDASKAILHIQLRSTVLDAVC